MLRRKSNKVIQALKKSGESFLNSIARTFQGISLDAEIYFLQRISVLLTAGISFEESLSIAASSEDGKRRTMQLKNLVASLRQGKEISSSFADSGIGFSKDTIACLSVGERMGALAQGICHAMDILTRKKARRSTLTQALMYPVFIVIATVGIVGFLVLYIFPKITPVFMSMNAKLPLVTRIVLGASSAIIENWLYITLAIFLAVCVFWMMWKYKKVRIFFRRIFQATPILKSVIIAYSCGIFFRMLGSMLEQGMVLNEALSLGSASINNELYQEVLSGASQQIVAGGTLSSFLSASTNLFPKIAPDLLMIGERTGSLSHICTTLADMFDHDLETVLKRLTSMLEPALMIAMGGIIGALALSIVLPIYSLTQNFN